MSNYKRKRKTHATACGLCKPHKRWGGNHKDFLKAKYR